ncbi:MAG: indolepyruvate oxidoreductase subunit beta [Proteobacteria bacterium]|nr:indolepyruvate oxidoreductase subunit beta [Pseudomonadota bacterium]MBU1451608.1 indolepyruvate oxidoreductase subunit beta [Pseudomonadota bacterium]MBU2470201.1 indolepyruvate oxidoreductase subunit beta [Pseudomonadota bacterium]MBU2519123.1 indolepyruvate oxidoreductase subunit beta [Pseudomonadota bacterium]
MSTQRIVFVGVGGQGNLLASNLLGQAALAAGQHVVVSEIHGMAQRGGVVESAVILGDATSPIVSNAEADVVVCFEPVEALRILNKANKDTLLITNTRPSPPFTVAIGAAAYPKPEDSVAFLRSKLGKVIAFDGQSLAEEAKNPLSLNMVMLGALFGAVELPIDVKTMKKIIRSQTKKRFAASNVQAFDLGFKAAA